MSADIPLYKLRNEKLTSFLEMYTGHSLPSETVVREQFVDKCYKATLEEIRKDIQNGPIWICIDETTDKESRFVFDRSPSTQGQNKETYFSKIA